MLEKNVIHVWKEALSSKPASRETFKGMHLSVLHQATQQKTDEQLRSIQFDIQDFILYELKGQPKALTGFPLPVKESEILWLCLQFHGKLSFPSGSTSRPDTLFSFISSGEDSLLTLPEGRQWVLLLGISGVSRQLLLTEIPKLRKQYDNLSKSITRAVSVTYSERQVLEGFAKKTFGTFSTLYHIGQLITELHTCYARQLDKHQQRGKDESSVHLYHRAIAYIQEHLMEKDLNREKVAAACNTTVRNLTRAFKERPNTLNSSILLMRIYKGREMLQKHPELSIEYIAGILHFSDAKNFATRYKKCFHRTPREERKMISL